MSKHIHPGLDHYEGEHNGPYVDLEDQDYFLALDTARGFAPDSAILQYALKRRQMDNADILLHLWCYRYTSGIIRDHSIIQIWILNPNS